MPPSSDDSPDDRDFERLVGKSARKKGANGRAPGSLTPQTRQGPQAGEPGYVSPGSTPNRSVHDKIRLFHERLDPTQVPKEQAVGAVRGRGLSSQGTAGVESKKKDSGSAPTLPRQAQELVCQNREELTGVRMRGVRDVKKRSNSADAAQSDQTAAAAAEQERSRCPHQRPLGVDSMVASPRPPQWMSRVVVTAVEARDVPRLSPETATDCFCRVSLRAPGAVAVSSSTRTLRSSALDGSVKWKERMIFGLQEDLAREAILSIELMGASMAAPNDPVTFGSVRLLPVSKLLDQAWMAGWFEIEDEDGNQIGTTAMRLTLGFQKRDPDGGLEQEGRGDEGKTAQDACSKPKALGFQETPATSASLDTDPGWSQSSLLTSCDATPQTIAAQAGETATHFSSRRGAAAPTPLALHRVHLAFDDPGPPPPAPSTPDMPPQSASASSPPAAVSPTAGDDSWQVCSSTVSESAAEHNATADVAPEQTAGKDGVRTPEPSQHKQQPQKLEDQKLDSSDDDDFASLRPRIGLRGRAVAAADAGACAPARDLVPVDAGLVPEKHEEESEACRQEQDASETGDIGHRSEDEEEEAAYRWLVGSSRPPVGLASPPCSKDALPDKKAAGGASGDGTSRNVASADGEVAVCPDASRPISSKKSGGLSLLANIWEDSDIAQINLSPPRERMTIEERGARLRISAGRDHGEVSAHAEGGLDGVALLHGSQTNSRRDFTSPSHTSSASSSTANGAAGRGAILAHKDAGGRAAQSLLNSLSLWTPLKSSPPPESPLALAGEDGQGRDSGRGSEGDPYGDGVESDCQSVSQDQQDKMPWPQRQLLKRLKNQVVGLQQRLGQQEQELEMLRREGTESGRQAPSDADLESQAEALRAQLQAERAARAEVEEALMDERRKVEQLSRAMADNADSWAVSLSSCTPSCLLDTAHDLCRLVLATELSHPTMAPIQLLEAAVNERMTAMCRT